MSLKKLEDEVAKLRKDNKILKEENKELETHNKFLLDRLETWAERNFQERQKWMNMTVDEVIAINKNKPDYAKEKRISQSMG
jgi:cell division protein FtsB